MHGNQILALIDKDRHSLNKLLYYFSKGFKRPSTTLPFSRPSKIELEISVLYENLSEWPSTCLWDLGKITGLVSLPTQFSLNPSPGSFPDVPPPHSHVCLRDMGLFKNAPFLSILDRSDCLHYLNIHPRNTRLLWLRHWSHCLHFQKKKKSYGTCFLKVWMFSTFKNLFCWGGVMEGVLGFLKYYLKTCSTLHQSKMWVGFSLGPPRGLNSLSNR